MEFLDVNNPILSWCGRSSARWCAIMSCRMRDHGAAAVNPRATWPVAIDVRLATCERRAEGAPPAPTWRGCRSRTHVGCAALRTDRDHDCVQSSAATWRASVTGSLLSSTRKTRPFLSAISAARSRSCGCVVAGAASASNGGAASIRTGTNTGFCSPFGEMRGIPPR